MILLVLLVIFHMAIVVLDVIAIGMIIIYLPWWISLPFGTIGANVYYQSINRGCPLTAWENSIRRRLGMAEVDNFLRWYFVDPFTWCFKKLSGR